PAHRASDAPSRLAQSRPRRTTLPTARRRHANPLSTAQPRRPSRLMVTAGHSLAVALIALLVFAGAPLPVFRVGVAIWSVFAWALNPPLQQTATGVKFQVQLKQKHEVKDYDKKGKPRYTTRHWIEVTDRPNRAVRGSRPTRRARRHLGRVHRGRRG